MITNIIAGLSYRVIVIEEMDREKIVVKLEYTDSKQIPNVVVYAPPEPTSIMHMPCRDRLREWRANASLQEEVIDLTQDTDQDIAQPTEDT